MPRRRPLSEAEATLQKAREEAYRKIPEEMKREWAARDMVLHNDERDIVAECREAGFDIESIWDFVNTNESYKEAIPVLLRHLTKEHHLRTREGLVRALTTPEARGIAAPTLIDLFLKERNPNSELKWLLGGAIAETATLENAMEVCNLIEDDSHGAGREFLPLALVHCPKPAAREYLKPLVEHPVVGKSARKAIRLLGK